MPVSYLYMTYVLQYIIFLTLRCLFLCYCSGSEHGHNIGYPNMLFSYFLSQWWNSWALSCQVGMIYILVPHFDYIKSILSHQHNMNLVIPCWCHISCPPYRHAMVPGPSWWLKINCRLVLIWHKFCSFMLVWHKL